MAARWLRYLPPFLRRPFAARGYLQRVVSNAAWLFGERLLRMAIGFLVGVWIARYLGLEQYGVLNYALAFVGTLGFLSTLGVEALAVRDMVRDPGCRDETLGTLLAMRLVGGAVLVVAAAAAARWLRPQDPLATSLVMLISIAQMLIAFDAIDSWFQANVASRYAVIAKAAAFLAATALRIGLILASAPLIAFAWAILAEAMLFSFAMLAAYRASGARPSALRATLGRARRLAAEGWPLALSALFSAVYLRIDQVMLGELSGFAEVGAYAVAARVVEVLYMVPTVIATSVFPAIIKSRELGIERYKQRMQSLYDVLLWIALPTAIALSLLAPHIVRWAFGSAFAAAGPVLTVLAWTLLWLYFSAARTRWLWAENATQAALAVEAAACVMNVLANLALIPRYGAVGAALASVLAAPLATLLAAPFSRSIRLSLIMFLSAAGAPARMLRYYARATR